MRAWFLYRSKLSHTRSFSILAEHKQPLQKTRSSLSEIILSLKGHGEKPVDYTTYKYALLLCGECKALAEGKYIHSHLVTNRLDGDRSLAACVIFMYAKCGDVQEAQRVFDGITEQSPSSWNGLLAAYTLNGHSKHAITLFHRMQLQGVHPNRASLATVFNACTRTGDLSTARSIYSTISNLGYVCNASLHNALLNTYCKLGSLRDVELLFREIHDRNVASWTLLVSAYAQHGHLRSAMFCMQQMQLEGIQPNRVTFLGVLEACIAEGKLETGRRIHSMVREAGIVSQITMGTTLVDMYTKCGSLSEAREVFDRMDTADVISWTAMISAYVKYFQGREALLLFKVMQLEGVKPNCVTCLICLNACAMLTDLKEGRSIHEKIVESGFVEENLNVGNALVDMYGSCGSLTTAESVFRRMHVKDKASWNSLIVSFAQDGDSQVALDLFSDMLVEGYEPDEITFVGVLYACCSAGMLAEGHQWYVSVTGEFGLRLKFEHCGCMLDLLSRVGWLEYAEEYVLLMPFYPDDKKWMTVLGACRVHGDAGRAKRAAQESLQLTPHDSSPYIVLSQTYVDQDEGEEGDEMVA